MPTSPNGVAALQQFANQSLQNLRVTIRRQNLPNNNKYLGRNSYFLKMLFYAQWIAVDTLNYFFWDHICFTRHRLVFILAPAYITPWASYNFFLSLLLLLLNPRCFGSRKSGKFSRISRIRRLCDDGEQLRDRGEQQVRPLPRRGGRGGRRREPPHHQRQKGSVSSDNSYTS